MWFKEAIGAMMVPTSLKGPDLTKSPITHRKRRKDCATNAERGIDKYAARAAQTS